MNNRKVPLEKWTIFFGLVVLVFVPRCALAQTSTTTGSALTPVPLVANPCPCFTAGGVIHNPPALYNSNGVLNVRFPTRQPPIRPADNCSVS